MILPGGRGRLLSAEDREKLRQLVPEFATKVLLPYAEKQILTLTELVRYSPLSFILKLKLLLLRLENHFCMLFLGDC